MIQQKLNELMPNGKSMILAYDHGLEHGPVEFDMNSVNPEYIIDIAEKGGCNGLVLHHGIAKEY